MDQYDFFKQHSYINFEKKVPFNSLKNVRAENESWVAEGVPNIVHTICQPFKNWEKKHP